MRVSAADELLTLGVLFYDTDGSWIAESHSEPFAAYTPAVRRLTVAIDSIVFNPGRYYLSFIIRETGTERIIALENNLGEIEIVGSDYGFTPVRLSGEFTFSGSVPGAAR